MTSPTTPARVEGTLDPVLAEKLSLAFDMRSKEVAAGLHGWDAVTQSLRVAILADIAGALLQYAQANPSHHDGAAPAPSVDGVVLPPNSDNQSERKWR